MIFAAKGLKGHSFVDLGDDEFTRGRPHPMIEPELRNEHVAAALADPKVGVILVDVVLGFGSHPDPAGTLHQGPEREENRHRIGGRHRRRSAGLVAPGRGAARGRRGGGAVERARRRARGFARQLARSTAAAPASASQPEQWPTASRRGERCRRGFLQDSVQRFVAFAGRGGLEVRRADGAGAGGEARLQPAPERLRLRGAREAVHRHHHAAEVVVAGGRQTGPQADQRRGIAGTARPWRSHSSSASSAGCA